MKRIFSLLFAAMLAGQAWAQTSFEVGKLKYTITGTNTVSVRAVSDTISGHIIIPEIVENGGVNYSVTKIDGEAFRNCSHLTSVTIPNTVTTISVDAFMDCSSLVSVTIPNQVSSIDFAAFAFCSQLTSINIPESVVSISGNAFSGCVGLTEIKVESDNAKYSSENGILFNKDKTTVICYPAGKTTPSYTIPNTVEYIGNNAFDRCKLTTLTIPNSVTRIGQDAFQYCKCLTSITIPNSVTIIGDEAFEGCSGLTSITIPNSVTSIGDEAFFGCSGLTSVTIPNSVTSIGTYAFSNCRNLKQIVCYATYETGLPTIGQFAFSYTSENCMVTVLCGQSQNYKDSDWGKYTNFTFVEDLLYEFTVEANNPEMGSVEILQMPDCSNNWATVKATANEGYVFVMWDDKSTNEENSNVHVSGDRHCTAYFAPADADINIIPKNYNTAFWYYNSDTKTLHVGGHGDLTIEADYMWGDLPKAEVEHVFIEDGFTYIDASTFKNFTALKDVRLPATLKMVGSYAFNGCESLESVVIPEGVREIEFAAFNGCSSMKYAVLPSTLQKMWSRAFGSCSMLDSVVVKCYTAIDLPSMVFGGSINLKFYIPCGKKDLYTSKDCWTINVTSNDNFVETMVYDLSVASSDSKRGTAEIVEMPDCGTAAIVKATAKPNYQFLKWSDGSTANPYEFALEKDLSLTAIFVVKESEITVEADTNGTVIVPQYAYFEDSVEVKISPKLGYEIDKLTITANGEKLELKNNKFMMPATDVNIAATFKLTDYKITTNVENGRIIVPETAHYGDNVTFNINPDSDYKFISVSVKDTADKNIRLVGDNSFIMPAANVTITAIFEKEDHTPVAETAANAVNIYAHGNTIVVENATDEIRVYNAMGILVAHAGKDDVQSITINSVGVYIVKTGGTVKRVVVN